MYVTLMLAWEITDPKQTVAFAMLTYVLGKEVSYVAESLGGACFKFDLQKYDVITTHTVSLHNTNISRRANMTP